MKGEMVDTRPCKGDLYERVCTAGTAIGNRTCRSCAKRDEKCLGDDYWIMARAALDRATELLDQSRALVEEADRLIDHAELALERGS